MEKKILIVDDDQEMLLSLSDGLKKYNDAYDVLMAGDGVVALDKLNNHTISLVVTDLKMPRMDGISLLAEIMVYHPHVPVIVITAYSTPEMKRLARDGGAIGYIEKPFMIEDLARKVQKTLKMEEEGGTLHSVSSGMFLQMVEMELRTCTIRLVDKASGKQGVLFFNEGKLLDARVDGLQGKKAAYEIFSWDEVALSIQNICLQTEDKIQTDLQALLLDAMRLKDENQEVEAQSKVDETGVNERMDALLMKLETEVGAKSGLENIYPDESWGPFSDQVQEIGRFFEAGEFKTGYINKGEQFDFIIIPGSPQIVITVSPKCLRDNMLKVLSRD